MIKTKVLCIFFGIFSVLSIVCILLSVHLFNPDKDVKTGLNIGLFNLKKDAEFFGRPKVIPTFDSDMCVPNNYSRGGGTMPLKRPCGPSLRDDGVSCWEDRVSGGVTDYIVSPGLPYAPSGMDSYGKGGCCTIFTPEFCSGGGYKCKEGFVDDGGCLCKKNECNINTSSYSNGRRDDLIGLLCYQICPPDHPIRDGIGCSKGCQEGYQNLGGVCWKGCGCIKTNLFERQYCKDGDEMNASLCYTKCDPGWSSNGIMCNSPVTQSYPKPRTPVEEGTQFQKIEAKSFQRDFDYEAEFVAPLTC